MQNNSRTNYATGNQNHTPEFPQFGDGSVNYLPLEEDLARVGMRVRGWDSWSGMGISPLKLQKKCPRHCPEQLQTPQPPPNDSSNEAIQPPGEPSSLLDYQSLDTQGHQITQTMPRDTLPSQALGPKGYRISRKRKRSSMKPKASTAVRGLSPLTDLSDNSSDNSEDVATFPLDSTPLSAQDKDFEVDGPPQKKRRSLRQKRRVSYTEGNGGLREHCSTKSSPIRLDESEEIESMHVEFVFRNLPGAAIAYEEMRRMGTASKLLLYHKDGKCRFVDCKYYNCKIPGDEEVDQEKTIPEKTSRDSFRRHVRSHFPITVGYVWKCPHCGRMYTRPDMASRNLKICLYDKWESKRPTEQPGKKVDKLKRKMSKVEKVELRQKVAEFKRNIYFFFENGKGYDFCGDVPMKTTLKEHVHRFDRSRKTEKKKKA